MWWLGYGTQLSIHPGPAVRAWVHCQACKGTGLRSGTTGLGIGTWTVAMGWRSAIVQLARVACCAIW